MIARVFSLVLLIAFVVSSDGIVFAAEPEFRPLFNGKNLDGWVRVNTAPATWRIEDEMLICSGKPIGELRTTKMYQNFILELEWRHMKARGNAGVFVWADDITARGVPFHRGIEVQVLENAFGNTRSHTTHGDIFPIHGATMTPINGRGGSRAFPTESRSKPSPEWNHYRIEGRDGEISLAVNGKVVTRGKDCSPRKGYICLESEGGIVHYRNIKIQELPDTPIEPAHIATANRDFVSFYSGLDLSGWKVQGEGWKSQDWILAYNGKTAGTLTTELENDAVGFVFDVRLTQAQETPVVNILGTEISIDPNHPEIGKHLLGLGKWNRFEGELQKGQLTLNINGQVVWTKKALPVEKSTRSLQLKANSPVHFANIYVRKLGR